MIHLKQLTQMVTYKTNFLKQVIFKLDFITLSDYDTKLKEIQKLIKKDFPILEEVKGSQIQSPFGELKATEFTKWVFYNKTNDRIVSFESNNIIIEFKEYSNFEDFFKILELVVTSLFNVFPSIVSTRLGLRYINQIELEDKTPFEWNNLLNKSLLESLNFVVNKKNLSRYMGMIELNKEDDYRLRFKYGIPNSLYPNLISKKEFTLDYDCFTLESLEKADVLKKTKQFNEVITEMFEKSIDKGLRKIMGGI